MADPLVLTRAIHLIATMLVTGVVAFDALVAVPALVGQGSTLTRLHSRSRPVLAGALAVALLSGAIWFALLAMRLDNVSAFSDTAWTLATETQFGTAWVLRLLPAIAIAASLARGPAASAPRGRSGVTLAAGAAFAGTLAWSGHGAATPGAAGGLHLAADVLHLIAAAAWLGGLLPLMLLLEMDGRNGDLSLSALVGAVRRFSRLGVAAVATLVVSGVVNTFFMIDRPALLWTDAYGRALLLKLILFAGMLMVAAHNRVTLTPELAQSTAAPARNRAVHRLWIGSAVEIALGVMTIAVVAWLGIIVPGGSMAHMH